MVVEPPNRDLNGVTAVTVRYTFQIENTAAYHIFWSGHPTYEGRHYLVKALTKRECLVLTPPSIENLNLSTSVHRLPLSFDILKSQSEVLPINVTQNAIDQLNLDWRVIGLNVSYQVTVASLQINEEGELRSAQTEAVKAEKEAGGEPPSLGKLKRLNA